MVRAHFDAQGEVLLATGGAHGITRAAALAFANAGGRSIILDLAEPDQEVLNHPNIDVHLVDISQEDAVTAIVAKIIEQYGRIDALIAGAAIQPRHDVLEQSAQSWQRVLEVNLNGVVWISRAVAPQMIQQRSGSMVFFTSGLALNGYAQASAYAASKAALIGYGKSLAAELFEHRIKVNLISPGVIDTPQFRAANPGADWEHWRKTTGIGQPEDVVGPLLFLLSDAATMSGSILSRDKALQEEAAE
ncbi:MAG: SDR family oxidoreductase [Microbacteriaceae bacterium]